MRITKNKSCKKTKLSYGLTLLVALMFFLVFIGNCLGLQIVDGGVTGSNKDNVKVDTDSGMVDSSSDSTDSSTVDSSSDGSKDSSDNTVIDSATDTDSGVVDSSSDITDNSNDAVSILGDTTDNEISDLSDNSSWPNLLNNSSSEVDELKSDVLNNIDTSISNERFVPLEEIESRVEKVFGNVTTGEKSLVLLKSLDEETGIKEVQFTATRDLTNVKVTVIKLKCKPDNISLSLKKNESVYRYLDIKLTSSEEYVAEDDIEDMKFTFKVEKTWIAENNIDKETILLRRYHDGDWQNLSTTLLSENDTYIFFEAESLGCSTFAVVGSQLVEISEPYATKTPEIPWTVIIGVIASTTIILVTVLFKARYIYFEEGPDKARRIYFAEGVNKTNLKEKNEAKK